MGGSKVCARCGERLPTDQFYFVSKKLGTRRGQCKNCMREVKAAQRDPNWKPTCARCGEERERAGPGRRLCSPCFDALYDAEDRRENGAHRAKLKDCRACGAKRLREDHTPNTALCPVCRSVPSGRRTKLKTLYNLNPREYLELMEAQGWRCAICKKKPRKKSLHIDHKHGVDPILRGGACNTCNTILGLARDNPEVLANASVYLNDPPAQRVFPGRMANPEADRYNKMTRSKH